MVARILVGGQDVPPELMRAGLAGHYKRYSSDPVLAEAEDQARRQKKGLLSIPNPVPPWEYRRLHRRQGEAGPAGSPQKLRDAVDSGIMPH